MNVEEKNELLVLCNVLKDFIKCGNFSFANLRETVGTCEKILKIKFFPAILEFQIVSLLKLENYGECLKLVGAHESNIEPYSELSFLKAYVLYKNKLFFKSLKTLNMLNEDVSTVDKTFKYQSIQFDINIVNGKFDQNDDEYLDGIQEEIKLPWSHIESNRIALKMTNNESVDDLIQNYQQFISGKPNLEDIELAYTLAFYCTKMFKFKKAYEIFNGVFKLYEQNSNEIKDENFAMKIFNLMGFIYQNMGRFEESTQCYDKCLTIADQTLEPNLMHTAIISYNNDLMNQSLRKSTNFRKKFSNLFNGFCERKNSFISTLLKNVCLTDLCHQNTTKNFEQNFTMYKNEYGDKMNDYFIGLNCLRFNSGTLYIYNVNLYDLIIPQEYIAALVIFLVYDHQTLMEDEEISRDMNYLLHLACHQIQFKRFAEAIETLKLMKPSALTTCLMVHIYQHLNKNDECAYQFMKFIEEKENMSFQLLMLLVYYICQIGRHEILNCFMECYKQENDIEKKFVETFKNLQYVSRIALTEKEREFVKLTSSQDFSKSSNTDSVYWEEKLVKKTKKKKTIQQLFLGKPGICLDKLPKNLDRNQPIDDERWLPLRDRSYYKPKRRKRNIVKGSQGSVFNKKLDYADDSNKNKKLETKEQIFHKPKSNKKQKNQKKMRKKR
ncbi:hypothetical protein A3Q56_02732 [Intoshia linei]|uniref:Signal recognition particle subunit SRP72 n=1 Tax=Intoshia linei TaxID=1819745 RepID=A0A177B7F4_9BILA|nr:hypothetical protein A3Q56_02732 [Intoshia linei]